MITIKQWQQPGRDTRVYNKFDAFKCHECRVNTTSASAMSLICCVDDCTSVQYCSDCWDNTEWNCPDCNKVPKDCDVIGCERCGQWSHQGCQINTRGNNKYTCKKCNSNACAQTLIRKMKIECYDLTKSLETTNKQLEERNDEIRSLEQIQEKMSEAASHTVNVYQSKKDELMSLTQVHRKTLSELNELNETYETQLEDYVEELKRVNNQVSALATDVMHQSSELQVSKDHLQAVTTRGRQEIVAIRENNKRLLSDNYSLNESNTKLKHSLQNARTKIADTMSAFKKNNKRARYMYEQQGEQIAALKKARVTLRWNGSMPKRLQERLDLQRYRDAWTELNCQWQNYFGEMRVRVHCEKGPVIYNTLDDFIQNH